MYTTARRRPVLDANAFRIAARAGAAVLFVGWLALFIAETVETRFEAPALLTVYQGIAFAVVFAGYAIGWRNELAGGLVAILGIIAFFAVYVLTVGIMPDLAVAWFAVPGALYLLAWHSDGVNGALHARQR